MKKLISLILAIAFCFAVIIPASAKTTPAGQTVGTVLFYITNAGGEEILVSHIAVSDMDADMTAGKIDDTLHNYSLLDRFVTPIHQEAQGFTVPEFVDYAQGKSTVAALKALPLSFTGKSVIRFWEIDQNGFDDMDSYVYSDLYGTPRYNFPLLYEYWDYTKQDYYDPAGKMTRDEVVDHIFKNGVPETFLLSVRAFSQRYMVTAEKYGVDYNLENYWSELGLLDTERTMRVMKPMTQDELYNKTPTAADTRYWTANIRLDAENTPDIKPLGKVAAPTATMTEDSQNYYIRFASMSEGATILYNHNFISPGYTPTSLYGDGAVVVPKEYFRSGTVTMTARAVKDGYTDAGVVTLELKATGTEKGAFTDVSADAWYNTAVEYVVSKGLFNGTSDTTFSPNDTMNRAMFVTVLGRLAGVKVDNYTNGTFSDVPPAEWYAKSVNWATAEGLVNGTGEGKFSPDDVISLEAMIAVLYRYSGETAGGETPANVGAISSWATDAMAWASIRGILDSIGGTLKAQGAATRAQVAAMLMNYAE